MATISTRPEFTASDVRDIIREHFNIKSPALAIKPLPSYVDQNYFIATDYSGQEFVFKISNVQETRELLILQNNALLHLDKKNIHAPRLVRSANSSEMITVTDRKSNGECYVRMLSWVRGRVFGDFQPQSLALMESLGQFLASVDCAFEDFNDPRARRPDFYWAMQNARLLWPMTAAVKQFSSPQRSDIVAATLRAFEERGYPLLTTRCRSGVIHCDANDQNILVNEQGTEVVALIDYGDVCMSYYICNLAIAMAYAMLTNFDRYKKVGAAVLKGYRSTLQLNEDELSLLPLFIKLRLVTSVVVSANAKISKPDDEYIVISERPAWALLEALYDQEEAQILNDLLGH